MRKVKAYRHYYFVYIYKGAIRLPRQKMATGSVTLALSKLYRTTDKPTTAAATCANRIEAALVCLIFSEKIVTDWMINTPITSFPRIVDNIHDLVVDIDQRVERSSYTVQRLTKVAIRVIVQNYHDYLITQL